MQILHFTTLLLASIFFVILFARHFFFLVEVKQFSMFPVLKEGDWALVVRHWPHRWLRNGQIVIVELERSRVGELKSPFPFVRAPLVKRIIGLPGDNVLSHRSDFPVLEGTRSITNQQPVRDAPRMREWNVPAGHCFVKGERNGFDSTIFGPIPFEVIQGVVLVRLFKSVGSEPDTAPSSDRSSSPQ